MLHETIRRGSILNYTVCFMAMSLAAVWHLSLALAAVQTKPYAAATWKFLAGAPCPPTLINRSQCSSRHLVSCCGIFYLLLYVLFCGFSGCVLLFTFEQWRNNVGIRRIGLARRYTRIPRVISKGSNSTSIPIRVLMLGGRTPRSPSGALNLPSQTTLGIKMMAREGSSRG
jgi:hypothetical protein